MRDRLDEIRANLSEAERIGSPELTYYGYVKYEDVKWLTQEAKRLKELGRELWLLSEKTGPEEYLTTDEMWRYQEIGEEFSPESFTSAPQGDSTRPER